GAPSSNSLAPCRQLYAHRLFSALGPIQSADCAGSGQTGGDQIDCPCKDGSSFCAVPATFELAPQGGVDVLVVDATEPTLQALRTELRPDQPEVDGILGTHVFRD